MLDAHDILAMAREHPSESLESETVEFKLYKSQKMFCDSLNDFSTDVASFANACGGVIIIGVADSHKVSDRQWQQQLVGCEPMDLIEISARLRGNLTPSINVKFEDHLFDGKRFILVRVPQSRDAVVGTRGGKYYRREGRSSLPMTADDIVKAVKRLEKYDWSAEELPADPIKSLDENSLRAARHQYRRRLNASEDIGLPQFLEAVGATRDGRLTKGGLALLGRRKVIQRILGAHEYRFSWKAPDGKLLANEIWDGCIWDAIQQAKSLFIKFNQETSIEWQGQTYRELLYNPDAFHEAFLNAVVHRDYTSDGMVSVTVHERKLTIASPGTFYGGITPENIARHEPRHRNKCLANMLLAFSLVDRAGMGVQRMGLYSLKYGRRFPLFEVIEDSVRVSLDGQYFKKGICMLPEAQSGKYGIPELLVLNRVYEVGCVPLVDLVNIIGRVSDRPWQTTSDAVNRIPFIEFCGTPEGIFVHVTREGMKQMEVEKLFNPGKPSQKYVILYRFLRKHGPSSSKELAESLQFSSTQQAVALMNKASFVRKVGGGANVKWALIDQ